ncbi:uncharacterized protein LOC129570310 [Sitodiplosis mosellana]|uniref:uncharacterized protein LOC129570310 n=1 Tax=Sitodiplosis mosellana TaxID=263140 RepID=UPI0024441DD8|nr:uncharacterized protein LOC129570310 [Sitodiplosis mosellana]
MKIPTVTNCCCCLSLRAAGLLIGAFGVLANMIGVLSGYAMVLNVIGLLVNSWFVFGILKENPRLMLPSIILTFFAIILMFLSPFFFIAYYHSEVTEDKQANNKLAYLCTALSLILYCIGVLSTYLWLVHYSLYKSIKAGAPRGPNVHVHVHKNGGDV